MGVEYASGFCKTCNAQRKIERKTPNHVLHLLIALVLGFFTLGIGAIVWLFVWFASSVRFGGWMCSTCGGSKIDTSFKMPNIATIAMMLLVVGLAIPMAMKNDMLAFKDVAANKPTVIKPIKNITTSSITEARRDMAHYYNSDQQPISKSSSWNNDIFTIKVENDGSSFEDFAEYICSDMASHDDVFSNNRYILIKINNLNNNNLNQLKCIKP